MGSEQRHRNLCRHVPVRLCRVTSAGQIIHANPAPVEMLGYPDKETLLSVNAVDLFVRPEDRQRGRSLLERQKVPCDVRVQLRRRDGSLIWVEDNARAVSGTPAARYYTRRAS